MDSWSHDCAIITLFSLFSFFFLSFLATETENVKHERGARPRGEEEGTSSTFQSPVAMGLRWGRGGAYAGIGPNDGTGFFVIATSSSNNDGTTLIPFHM